MSKLETINKSISVETCFGETYERLKAIDSVVVLVANFADAEIHVATNFPDKEQLASAYNRCKPFTRDRFDRSCNDLARVASVGAQALLSLKSQGRHNLGAAARRLIREIEQMQKQSQRLLGL